VLIDLPAAPGDDLIAGVAAVVDAFVDWVRAEVPELPLAVAMAEGEEAFTMLHWASLPGAGELDLDPEDGEPEGRLAEVAGLLFDHGPPGRRWLVYLRPERDPDDPDDPLISLATAVVAPGLPFPDRFSHDAAPVLRFADFRTRWAAELRDATLEPPVRPPVASSPPDGHHGIVAASVTGTRHLGGGGVCDDACGWRTFPGGVALVAADGAGFAGRAAEGAQRAIQAALDAAVPPPDDGWAEHLATVLELCREELLADDDPAQLSTTLVFALWSRDKVGTLQVGDGAIVARAGDELSALTRPDHGEYYNETVFLVSDDAVARAQIDVVEGAFEDLALLTDGIQALALELAINRPVPGFFSPFFAMAREPDPEAQSGRLARFLASARVCARTDDDKTLVVASRVEP